MNIEATADLIMSARHSDAFDREACVKVLRDNLLPETAQERIANALESVLDKEKGCLRMVDVDRANVYKTHLGKKLSDGK